MFPDDSPLLAALAPYDLDEVLTSTTVTYGFMGSGVSIDAGDPQGPRESITWSEPQKDYVRDIFSNISTVVDLTFVETASSGTANIEFIRIDMFTDNTTGVSIPVADQMSQIVVPTEYIDLGDVTLIHEIGHSLALSHPFDGPANLPGVTTSDDLGTFSLNTELATRMSYLPGFDPAYPNLDITGEPSAFGAIDIAMLQMLYGANTSTGLGDTTYGIDPVLNTIWDNGGNDTIDFSAATDNAVIDLRAATLAVEAGGGGFLSFVGLNDSTLANGGYTIAYGVVVENARGGSGADAITGNAEANEIFGGSGNDMILGGAGDDILNGEGGMDTATYSGNQASYTLTLGSQGTTLTDRRDTGDGNDTLLNFEAIAFGDNTAAPFDLTKFAGTQNLTSAQMESFIELYIAYFNRAPDAIGLNFWGTAFATGTSLQEMATLFIDQDETRTTYPETLSNADFATAVYSNVLGRAADQLGFDFWVGVLNDGSVTRDQFILSVLEGAKAAPPADAPDDFIIQQLADQQYLSLKTDIGAYYSVIRGLSDVGNASAAMMLFDGSAASVTTAQNAIDGYHTAALDGETGAFLMPLVGVIDNPFLSEMV